MELSNCHVNFINTSSILILALNVSHSYSHFTDQDLSNGATSQEPSLGWQCPVAEECQKRRSYEAVSGLKLLMWATSHLKEIQIPGLLQGQENCGRVLRSLLGPEEAQKGLVSLLPRGGWSRGWVPKGTIKGTRLLGGTEVAMGDGRKQEQ